MGSPAVLLPECKIKTVKQVSCLFPRRREQVRGERSELAQHRGWQGFSVTLKDVLASLEVSDPARCAYTAERVTHGASQHRE